MATCAQLQSLPQQFSQQLLVPEFVGAKALQLQHLLIGQRLKGWTLLLLALLLSHVSYIFMCCKTELDGNSKSIKSCPPLIGIQKYLLFFGLVPEEAQLHLPKLLLSYLDLPLELGLSGSKWPFDAPCLLYFSKVLIVIPLPFRIPMQAFFKIEQLSCNPSTFNRLQQFFSPDLLESHIFSIVSILFSCII